MLLFKASGATYLKVIRHGVHAFPFSPKHIHEDEFVLLSKNRSDCRDSEKQIQYVAKVLTRRRAAEGELNRLFPGVGAGERWKCIVELYWGRRLSKPFNLNE